MKFFKHSLITFLSLMVFITSSGLTVNLYYCANELQKISIKQENTYCFMQSPLTKSCEATPSVSNIKKNDSCCKVQKIQAKSQNKIIVSEAKEQGFFLKSVTFIKSYFESIFAFNNSDKDEEKEKEVTLFPLLKKGLYILLQQFRN